jgi:hypothetical protein
MQRIRRVSSALPLCAAVYNASTSASSDLPPNLRDFRAGVMEQWILAAARPDPTTFHTAAGGGYRDNA